MAMSRLCMPKARYLFQRSILQQKPAVFARPVRYLRRSYAQAEPQKDASKHEGQLAKQQQGGSDLTAGARRRGGDWMQPFFPPGLGRMTRYIDQMQREMDELAERLMPGSAAMLDPFLAPLHGTPTLPVSQLARQLAFEVEEDDKSFTLRAAVPGLSKDEVKITLSEDNVLTIRGEKKEESEQQTEGGKRTSTMFRSVFKQLRLPQNVGAEHISAETKDGVLTIVLPKTEVKESVKEIPVK